MTDEELLKKHPSLGDKDVFAKCEMNKGGIAVRLESLHKTQIDKKIVKKALEEIRKIRCDCENIARQKYKECYMCELIHKKEKELGLK